jgi:hypothetical protein
MNSLISGFSRMGLMARKAPAAGQTKSWMVAKTTIPALSMDMAVRGMANHKHKKIIKLAKGFRGRANRCFTVAYHRVQVSILLCYILTYNTFHSFLSCATWD